MLRLFEAGKMLLYLAACLFGGYRGFHEIQVAATETQPAEFAAADFRERYQGEQWVRVVGRVAVEHRDVRSSPYKAHRGKDLAYVMAPIVAEEWRPNQPVDVLATFGPMPQASVEAWSRGFNAAPQPVQGQVRSGGVRDPQGMFPKLRIGPSYIVINVGGKPKHLFSMVGFLTLMVVSGGIFAARIRSIVKNKEASL